MLSCESLYEELIQQIKLYHPATHLSLIEKAYRFAVMAHGDQMRISGEPYIIHPLSVAVILAELELDLESIVAGILHDVVEDTEYTSEDITRMFGEEISLLVDGVTKLEKMEYISKVDQKAENYRKMFLAMAKDIRVILIKIADRLHNMRTLQCRREEKRREVAQETLDLYAPLAHRLGISRLRYELEDLSFKYLNESEYYDLADKIILKQSERLEYMQLIVDEVRIKLDVAALNATVDGRPKHFFSIYKKMVGKNKTLDQIYDLFAIRILVNEVRECYEVLGLLHEMYTPVPGRFKDYIGMPKANRYQSLHTTLIGQDGEPFEVQIRTWEMQRVAEYGIAAHWKYKEGKGGEIDPSREEAKLSWLRQMMDWQREFVDGKEYIDALKLDLNVFKDHVYCFSPKGEVISLINGSTPIDFAYAIHSAVGNKMIGARVNNKIVTFDHVLETGDRVEIITSQNAKGPGKDWLKLVKTTQARSKINQWFKRENREDNVHRGRELLEKEAKRRNVTLAVLLADSRESFILHRFNCHDFETLCASVGYGGVREGQVINKLYNEYRKEQPITADAEIIENLLDETDRSRDRKKKSGIVVKDVGDINVRFSKCCSPLPGDEIVGFITRGRGVSIHRSDCLNIMNLDEIDRRRIIDAEWQLPENAADNRAYRADLRIVCNDRLGLLADITRVLSDERVKIKALNVRTVHAEAIFNVGIEIVSREQLNNLCTKIMRQHGVHEIERVTS